MKESDIRPDGIMEELIALCAQDAKTYFVDYARENLACPACDSWQNQGVFEKNTFQFVLCEECGSLYQSPRPPLEAFTRFYQDSPSSRFLANTFYPRVAALRKETLFRTRVREVARLLEKEGLDPEGVGEVGAGYGLFLEEWERAFPGAELVAIEPNTDMAAICRDKGFKVIESFVENIPAPEPVFDLLVGFEVIEHAYDPFMFCRSLKKLMAPRGRTLLTSLTVEGFDIQVLWEQAPIIAPANHLNFFSIQGFEILLQRAGFQNVSVFTPGKLDVEIVQKAVAEGFEIPPGLRFIETLLTRSEAALDEFQTFLSRHNLSSHCWVWASSDGIGGV